MIAANVNNGMSHIPTYSFYQYSNFSTEWGEDEDDGNVSFGYVSSAISVHVLVKMWGYQCLSIIKDWCQSSTTENQATVPQQFTSGVL